MTRTKSRPGEAAVKVGIKKITPKNIEKNELPEMRTATSDTAILNKKRRSN